MKKRLKKLTAFIMAVVMIMVSVPLTDSLVVAKADETLVYGEFKYEVLEDGTVEIIGYDGNAELLEIPEEIDGKKVTSIGEYAFSGCSSLMKISISSGVTSIGKGAFRGYNIKSIEVDEENAIYDSREGCNAIIKTSTNELVVGCGNTKIPSNVESIGNYAFYGCSLTEISIPSSVTNIESCAFFNCSSLISIEVDEENAVYDSREGCNAIIRTSTNELVVGCKNTKIPSNVESIGDYVFFMCSLTEISIPSSVTSIGRDAFDGCINLTEISIPSSVTSIGKFAFSGCSNLIEMSIPNGVTSIEESSFINCISLTEISIPSSVTSIGRDAFSGCSNLTEINIPSSVTNIGAHAFGGRSITSIEVDEENAVYDSREGCNAIIRTSTNELVVGCKNTKIPSGITSIE